MLELEPGVYTVQGDKHPVANMPFSYAVWGTLLVFESVNGAKVVVFVQNVSPTKVYINQRWFRSVNFGGWAQLANE